LLIHKHTVTLNNFSELLAGRCVIDEAISQKKVSE